MSGPPGILATPMERLQTLDLVENEILTCIHTAGQALAELGKDKPSGKLADQHVAAFMKTLNHVELEIGRNINYLTQVSTGQSHEGSSYASQKVLQMAWHRSEHARSRVLDLDRMKSQMLTLVQKSVPTTPRPASSSISDPNPPSAAAPPPSASTQVHTPQTPYSASN